MADGYGYFLDAKCDFTSGGADGYYNDIIFVDHKTTKPILPFVQETARLSTRAVYELMSKVIDELADTGLWTAGANRDSFDPLADYSMNWRKREDKGGEILRLADEILSEGDTP